MTPAGTQSSAQPAQLAQPNGMSQDGGKVASGQSQVAAPTPAPNLSVAAQGMSNQAMPTQTPYQMPQQQSSWMAPQLEAMRPQVGAGFGGYNQQSANNSSPYQMPMWQQTPYTGPYTGQAPGQPAHNFSQAPPPPAFNSADYPQFQANEADRQARMAAAAQPAAPQIDPLAATQTTAPWMQDQYGNNIFGMMGGG